MSFGEWARIVLAAVVGLGALLLLRGQEALLTIDELGVLVFLAAYGYALLQVRRHFDRHEGRSDGESR